MNKGRVNLILSPEELDNYNAQAFEQNVPTSALLAGIVSERFARQANSDLVVVVKPGGFRPISPQADGTVRFSTVHATELRKLVANSKLSTSRFMRTWIGLPCYMKGETMNDVIRSGRGRTNRLTFPF